MNEKQHQDRLHLECEALEQRQMLSTVDVFAAGVTNEETIELQIDGATVQTWENVGGDAFAGDFVRFSYTTDQDVEPGQIRIAFTNDVYDEAAGIDRNVRIDRIVVDGETIETASAEVFSTGTWKSADGIVPGFGRGDILHANGFFQFPASQVGEPGTPGAADGSDIQVAARGSEGTERFNLVINGRMVATFDATLADQTFSYTHTDTVSASDVRIEFFNDRWEPEAGIDANLIVDKINVDGIDYQTEAPTVFSTGTWKAADGIVPGNRESETLHTNGFFQFADAPTPEPPTPEPPIPSNIAPVANNDVGNTTQASTAITLDVLANDFDADDDDLTIADASLPAAQGTVAIVDNQLVYTPADGFDSASVAISYIVSDGTDTDTARAFVFVSPVSTPTPPTSTGLSFVTEATVRFDDLDGGVWQRVFDFGNGPGQDNLLLTQLGGSNTMRFDFYVNGQIFTLDAVGGIVEGETATWKAQVTDAGVMQLFKDGTLVGERSAAVVPGVDRANLLVGESNWSADTPLIGQVVSISADIDGDGTTDLSQNTTPNPPSPEPPTPNVAPNANDDPGNVTNASTAITLDVLANDTDADGNLLTISDASVLSSQGTVAIVNNQLVYTPADDFGGVTTEIRYTISDGNDGSDSATAFVYVFPGNSQTPTPQPPTPNVAPNANDDPGNVTNASTAITLDVLANDTDADGNSLTIADASVPSSQGTVSIANNQLVFTPAEGFGGVTTEIQYTISDGNGGADSATAFVFVVPGNTLPPTPEPPTPQPPTPQPPTPQPPTTSGLSFFTEVTAQFNAVNFSSQRIFDYGNGFNKDSIYLGQIGASNDLQFGFFSNGQLYTLDAPGAIVQNENATWRTQVTNGGLMQLFKNDVLLAERQAVAVPDLPRKFLMVGISTDNSAPKFIGAISSITADINGDGNPDKVGTEALKFNPDDEVATSPTFATDRRPAKNTPVSGNPIIDTLTWSMQWDADVITWAFEEHDLDNDGINDWEEGNWRNFYEGMMADVTTYTGLRFVEQPRTNAVVTFRLNPTGGGGISRTPNNGGVKTDTQVGINPSNGMETITDVVYPGQFSEAFYHELGHALGFDHPTADGFDFGPISGENAFISSGPTGLNSKLYSVMTYANFFWAEDNPFTPQFDTKTVQQMWPGSYLPFDIAAFQFMYGINSTHALGDDVYTFNDDRRQSAGIQAIWDNGGTDAIRYTGSSRTVINLNDATLQREIGGGGFLSTSESLTTGYLIANGVVVENAIGGNNADILTGNEFANELVGNGGNDTLDGGGGNDTLIGGAGDNTIRGGTGFDVVVVAGTQGGAQVSNNGGGNFVIRAQDGSIARVSGVEEVRFLGGGSLTLQAAEPDFFFSPSPPVAEILRANLPTVQVSSADVAPEALNYVFYSDVQGAEFTGLNRGDHNHDGDDCGHDEHGEMLAEHDSGKSHSHAHEDGCGCAACVAAASLTSSMLDFTGQSG